MKMSEHRYMYDIRISESCVDPNQLMVEKQDPDNFTRFQTQERCALEIAAYVFKEHYFILGNFMIFCRLLAFFKIIFIKNFLLGTLKTYVKNDG